MRDIDILLVEDNEGDIVLTSEALSSGKVANKIRVARDGEEALRLLGEGVLNNTLPDLILLDINLPKIDGKELLRIIKSDDNLRRIPVVMLTTSSHEKDIIEAYNENANCYITKPVDYDKFIALVKVIENFWINIVTLPPVK